MNTKNRHKINPPVTVAVIDDHDVIREKVSEILTDFGFDIVLKACNGSDLLKQLSSTAELPALCLLDISMPIMNGYETAQNLRHLYPGLKILAFSMDNDDHTIEKVIKCGAHGFAEKNIDPCLLRDKLIQLVNVNMG